MAEEAWSVVFLQVAVLPLDGGVPWSSSVDLLPTASPRLCGAAQLVSPFAGVRETADLAQERPMDADVQRHDDDGDFRCRSCGIGDRRLPAGLGGLRIQGFVRSWSSGAPPTALVVSGVVELHKGWAVFFVSLEGLCVFCRCISVFVIAKKIVAALLQPELQASSMAEMACQAKALHLS
jgi:hypothetical protein